MQAHREIDSIYVLQSSLYQKYILDWMARLSASPDTDRTLQKRIQEDC